jgi:hypothetical protein
VTTTAAEPLSALTGDRAQRGTTAFDALLRGTWIALAVLSVAALPWAAGRLPDGAARLDLLLWTGAVALLAVIPVTILSARIDTAAAARANILPGALGWVTALALPLVIVLAAVLEFRGWPQFPDTFAEMFHARVLAGGDAWARAPARQELVQIANTVVDGERWYSQYPIGNVALLALGLRLNAPWLPPLLVGGMLAAGTYIVARAVSGLGAAVVALALAAASPMLVLSSAAMMSQATTAALVICALAVVLRSASAALGMFGAGVLGGLAVCVRPLDGVILLAALAVHALLQAARARSVPVLALAAGAGIGALPLLIGNFLTTGAAFRFGYNVLWGGGNMPGFGTRGWGVQFGAAEAVTNLAFGVSTLNLALLEWPLPVLLVVAAAVFTLPRPIAPAWRLLLGYALLQIAVYFLYWHHDFFFGPRFLLPVAPVLLVLLGDAAIRAFRNTPSAAVRYARNFVLVQAVLAAVLVAVPRYANARSGMVAAAALVDSTARAELPAGSVVLVNDGWGSRLFGEMWALGISAAVAEQLYAAADACALQRAIDAARVRGVSGVAAGTAVRTTIARDGAGAGLPLGRAPAPLLRLPAGTLPPDCAAQLAFDERTFGAPFAPLLWRNDSAGALQFMRDPGPARALPGTSGAVFRAHPMMLEGEPVVRFTREGGAD